MKGLPPELLRELQGEYIKTFDEKIHDLSHSLECADFDSLESQFHKLAGSGTTYGMPEISKLSRGMENYLKESPKKEFEVVSQAIEILKGIFADRKAGKIYDLDSQPFIKVIQNYLE